MTRLRLDPTLKRQPQQGVVLVIALIMLALLSILATMSIRGASSTEQVANQSRLKELAQQTAEAALYFCEQQVRINAVDATKGIVPDDAPVGTGTPYMWENMAIWDAVSPPPSLNTVPVAAAGDTGSTVYFARAPECMSQYMSLDKKVFVTTARGFGPDVSAKLPKTPTTPASTTNAPKGTEIWLQSVVTME
jgi:type IV pilus assembly protein PilX